MKQLDWRDYYDSTQPLIYVAGPYTAPTREGVEANIRRACAARDRLIAAGWSVICPHANTAHMPNDEPAVFYTMDLTQLARCDAVYMLRKWQDSTGAMIERKFAFESWKYEIPINVYYESLIVPTPYDYRKWCVEHKAKSTMSDELYRDIQLEWKYDAPLPPEAAWSALFRAVGQERMREYDERVVKELGMQDETVTNEHGGKQSRIDSRLSLLPPEALMRVGAILTTGAAKYGDDNWRLISQRDHLDHALRHIVKYLSGDTTEDHLGNAACRLLFAISDLRVGVTTADVVEEGD